MLLHSGAMLQITGLIHFLSKCDCPVNVMDYFNLSDLPYGIKHSFLEFFSYKHRERQYVSLKKSKYLNRKKICNKASDSQRLHTYVRSESIEII